MEHLGIYEREDDEMDYFRGDSVDYTNPHPNTLLDKPDSPVFVPFVIAPQAYIVEKTGSPPVLYWDCGQPVMWVPLIIPSTISKTVAEDKILDKVLSE